MNDYYNNFWQEAPKKFTLKDVPEDEIRRRVTARAKVYEQNTGRFATPELKQLWVDKIRNKKSLY
jgi:hypothetical protein